MRRIDGFVLAAVLTLAGCAAHRVPAGTTVTMAPPAPWRAAIAAADAARIDAMPARWAAARTRMGRSGATALRREGDLLRADAALPHPAMPPGSYTCRSIVMAAGVKAAGVPRPTKPFFCYIGDEAGERVSFTKQTGTALPGGWLYPDGDRYVFLGARQRRAGDVSLGYGTDHARDLIGVVERIGAFRWRLVLPGEPMEVYELLPVPPERQAGRTRD